MDFTIIFSIIFAFGCIIFGFIFEGGDILSLLQVTPFLIVVGGTIGAVGISFPLSTLKCVPKALKIAFNPPKTSIFETIKYLQDISVRSRKNGLLSLEAEINRSDLDSYIKKGLQMVIDGIEAESTRSVLYTKLEQLSTRHEKIIEVFSQAGGYAPTMGIVGTITSLVIILSNLSDAASLGGKIAVAFVATLYGLGTANLIWLPIGSKLKEINNEEVTEKEMIIEAILLIQEGVNPNTLLGKLEGYLTDDQIKQLGISY